MKNQCGIKERNWERVLQAKDAKRKPIRIGLMLTSISTLKRRDLVVRLNLNGRGTKAESTFVQFENIYRNDRPELCLGHRKVTKIEISRQHRFQTYLKKKKKWSMLIEIPLFR